MTNQLDFPMTVYVNEDGRTRVIQGSFDEAEFGLDFGPDVEFIGVANGLHELVVLIQCIH
jgi:hypothetical protein